MRPNQFNRVLRLVRRTGDRLVVLDRDTDTAFVVMDLDRYEEMLDESEFTAGEIEPDQFDEPPFGAGLLDAEDDREKIIDRNISDIDDSEIEPTETLEVTPPKKQPIKIEPIDDDFATAASVLRERWGDMATAESQSVLKADAVEPTLSGEPSAKEIPLDDVSEEDEDTFLLEPVE